MYDICCIGHITLDKVVTPQAVKHMAGGTSFYFSSAIRNMDVSYTLVTSLAENEMPTVDALRAKGTEVHASTCAHTVYFENIYSGNQDHRTQRVLQKADPFTVEQLQGIDAQIFHLGPLLADDIPVSLIKELSSRGRVSLDAQGYLRKVEDKNVIPVDWPAKKEALQYIDILKVNEHELEALTGLTDIKKGALVLADWGVKEVVITLGSMGSVIYAGGLFYSVPAYIPTAVVDATGCGDTYMAGYLYQRIKGAAFQEAGEFAAAMASFKIESSGPFTGTKEDVLNLLEVGEKNICCL
ncbi:PfkB family carbohydrate kinase [Mucilaginibacter sp. SG564]|uniref:PfkB family carbohydrate kinase n=1 Tax=unclassified Mucilaginibacter TaxID=2617802 RepID=UPI001555A760|nr:PfkB family carbohydrate kinase [Mucilaginibacter sp. SG564]NOW96637.1 sugar/nucleoside kinase (ribokinase family) [Mucilaginibacter sp. SG564]